MTRCILNNIRTTACPGSIYFADCDVIVCCMYVFGSPMRVTRIENLGHISLVTMQRAVKSLAENNQGNDKGLSWLLVMNSRALTNSTAT